MNLAGAFVESSRSDDELYAGQAGIRIVWSSASTIVAASTPANTVFGGLVFNAATTIPLTSTLNLMSSDGSDSSSPASPSTLYYVYLAGAGDFAGGLAWSSTTPSLVTSTYGRSQYLLGSSGDAASIGFVGCVFTDAVGEFTDTPAERHVGNFYNRTRSSLLARPAYSNSNSKTTFGPLNNAVFAPINAGTADSVSWIDWGTEAVDLAAQFTTNAATTALALLGIGDDSSTSPAVVCALPALAIAGASASLSYSTPVGSSMKGSRRRAYLLGMTTSANVTFVADYPRTGAAADPCATYLTGSVRL